MKKRIIIISVLIVLVAILLGALIISQPYFYYENITADLPEGIYSVDALSDKYYSISRNGNITYTVVLKSNKEKEEFKGHLSASEFENIKGKINELENLLKEVQKGEKFFYNVIKIKGKKYGNPINNREITEKLNEIINIVEQKTKNN